MSPRFILIEQSLRSLGGHHHEYATEVLRAAESAGYEPILATNGDFTQLESFPNRWQVIPIFPYRSDRVHRVPKATSYHLWQRLLQPGGSLGGRTSGMLEGIADRVKSRVNEYRWGRQRSRIAGFAAACRALFEQIQLQPGDHVYCSTVSDMDLLGLVRFLKNHPNSQNSSWHLQFHFGVFSGRDPDYAKQYWNVGRLRNRFETAARDLSNHNVYFYTTTDELRRQFNRLESVEFQTLPWPVSPRFRVSPRKDTQQPLRLVCAGGARREKGGAFVGPLVRALNDEFLESNKLKLLIQTGKKRRTRKMLGLDPRVTTELDQFSSNELPESSVVTLPHPLPPDAYADLIRNADIGLLLYDSNEYFARCSGILLELFAAGIPVIGPAGCWLGEQIEQANGDYLGSILSKSQTVSQWDLASLASSDQIVRRERHVTEFRIEEPGADLLVQLAPLHSAAQGTFARVYLQQFAEDGSDTIELTKIVGTAVEKTQDESLITSLFPIHDETVRVRLTTENAFDVASSPVRQQFAFLINDATGKKRNQPMGRVGLTFSSPRFIPQLLRDIVTNYEHYRTSREELAIRWQRQHAPARTIEKLTAAAQPKHNLSFRSAG